MGGEGAIATGRRRVAGYRPLPGVPDEMLDKNGQVRPLWRNLVAHLDALSDEDLTRDLARADRYLLDSGVFYRQYGEGQSTERPWPLSHIPVLLAEDDWARIGRALTQRADLLEAVMADLYGPNELVASGRLPATLVAGNPEWLRPMVGIKPRGGHFLHFLAFELGRGPDGQWWVLADRTQAPSGAGYALENRVAISRAYSELYPDGNVHRLAGFFRDFRDALQAQSRERDGRVAILTPGPMNETYYEHAYIARYLGFTLLEGDDLGVSNDRLMVRTVQGMRQVDVLWRRLDGQYADPLELNPASRIGTPGMVAALRSGAVAMVNSLGSGVLETRALMAFLPQLAPDLVGAPLAMTFLALETTGNFVVAGSVLAAVTVAGLVTRRLFGYSFATWRFHLRGETIRSAHDIGWLRELSVGRLMRRDLRTVRNDTKLSSFKRDFPLGSTARVVAVDEQGRYAGLISVAEAYGAAPEVETVEPLLQFRDRFGRERRRLEQTPLARQ